MRTFLIALATLGFASTAFAGGSDLTRYYIGKDLATGKCSVVQQRPADIKMTEATSDWYESEAKANAAMAELAACKT
jgi:hypothetical protein